MTTSHGPEQLSFPVIDPSDQSAASPESGFSDPTIPTETSHIPTTAPGASYRESEAERMRRLSELRSGGDLQKEQTGFSSAGPEPEPGSEANPLFDEDGQPVEMGIWYGEPMPVAEIEGMKALSSERIGTYRALLTKDKGNG